MITDRLSATAKERSEGAARAFYALQAMQLSMSGTTQKTLASLGTIGDSPQSLCLGYQEYSARLPG